jgi:DNA-binding transcriptional LysR family regulator
MIERELLESDAVRAFAVFAVFAEHRNFTTAAAVLHLSQPSLHVKIRKLADGLGVRLYERDGRRLTLTAAGQRLAAFAADSTRRSEEFLRELRDGAPALTVAAGRGTLRWIISPAIRRLSAQGRQVRILTADRDQALAALSAGSADIAVIGYDPPPREVEAAEIAAYPQVLVIDSTSPLAGRQRLRLADLNGLHLVVPPPQRPHRKALDRALRDAGVRWQPAAEADGWDLLVHLAGLGIGATVVNGCVRVTDGLTAVPITDLPVVRYWAIWRRQRHPQRPDFLDHFRPQ